MHAVLSMLRAGVMYRDITSTSKLSIIKMQSIPKASGIGRKLLPFPKYGPTNTANAKDASRTHASGAKDAMLGSTSPRANPYHSISMERRVTPSTKYYHFGHIKNVQVALGHYNPVCRWKSITCESYLGTKFLDFGTKGDW